MKFFSFLLKQKKLIFLSLLLLIVGLIVPQVIIAGAWGCIGGGVAGAAAGTFIPGVGNVIGGIIGGIAGCVGGYFFAGNLLTAVGEQFLIAATTVTMSVAQFFLGMSSGLFSMITNSAILLEAVTKDKTVLHGWAIVRDFANMFIVLGFTVVGLATILRIRTYEAQKTLLPLILVALLINFSLLICGLMIDAANITMDFFLRGPVSASAIAQPLNDAAMNPEIPALLSDYANNKKWESYITVGIGNAFFAGIAAMILFIFGILLLFRKVALMCLVILAPLAFVCYVFPATKSIFDKWWQQFAQWTIIGIPTVFFLYLGAHIAQMQGLGQTGGIAQNDLSFWIPVGFLLFAYSLIFQTSAIGASAAIGLATGAVGFAGGKIMSGGKSGLKGGLKGLGNKTGITDKAKTMGGAALERIGLRSKGTTAQKAQKEMDERKKRLGIQTEDKQVAGAKGRAFTPEQIRNKVANIENLAKENKLHKIGGVKEQADAIALTESYAKSRGYDTTIRKDAEKGNPELAKYNPETRNKILGANPSMRPHEVDAEAIKQKLSGLNTISEARKISPDFFKNATNRRAFADAYSSTTLQKIIPGMSQEQKNALNPMVREMAGLIRGLPTSDPKRKEYAKKARAIKNALT